MSGFCFTEQQIGSVNCLVENSTVMKGPKKMTCRRMLPKVIPLKGELLSCCKYLVISFVSNQALFKKARLSSLLFFFIFLFYCRIVV